jgi:uncharacterized OsmC-like protein
MKLMTDDSERAVSIERTGPSRYLATNVRGGTLPVSSGDDADFTPVELLLTAIGACSAVDVDLITSRRAEPTSFSVAVRGDKIRDPEAGNRLVNLEVVFTVTFSPGPEGDRAREALPRAVQMSHDRLCTVSRTVELGTPVTTRLAPADET